MDVLQVRGAAVPAVWAPGAQQAGQAGAGVVPAFSEERDLGREEKKVTPLPSSLWSAQPWPVSHRPHPNTVMAITEEETEAQRG